ncbi:MAG: hypothetical protein QXZ41_00245 [Ignisphaera sp.]
MILVIKADEWFNYWRIEIFSTKIFHEYPRELPKFMTMIKYIAKRSGLPKYLMMLIFEVFWSIYFGPIMPWKATCNHCLVYQRELCRGQRNPIQCVLQKVVAELKRVVNTSSNHIYIGIEPPINTQVLENISFKRICIIS